VDALGLLEGVPAAEVQVLGCRLLWQLVSALGFAPSLDACARDGAAVAPEGPLPFSAREGGALCPACASVHGAALLPADARLDLEALLDPVAPLPTFDPRHAVAHRRLLGRYIRHHLAEETALPALDFWMARSWDRS
jgi:DNA repair protein RecO (recombination protein O)